MANTLGLNRFGFLATVIFAIAACSAAQAADKQHWPPPGVSYYGDPSVPDISGLWLGTVMGVPGKGPQNNTGSTADGRPPAYWAPWPLPYTPAFQKIYDERVEATKKGRALGDIGSRCLPFGMTFAISSKVYPDEIVQTPGQVTIFIFGTFPITVWTDGRGHPKDWVPSYNGHSIGHWVGDALHVDTVGIKGETPLDGMRNPHSAKLNVKWSIQRVAKEVLHFHIRLYDEDAFTEPVVTTNISHRKDDPRWQIWDDASCFENNKTLSPGATEPGGFIKF